MKIGNKSFGADYGEMRFEDVDNDGMKEAIIETKQPFYSFYDIVTPSIVVLKYIRDKNNNPKFIVLREYEIISE